MYNIYKITDDKKLNYVGITKQTIIRRFDKHKSDKNTNNNNCSSKLLNLDKSIITLLEKTNDKTREKYWINKIDCVNKRKLNFDRKKYQRDYQRYRRSWGGLLDISPLYLSNV